MSVAVIARTSAAEGGALMAGARDAIETSDEAAQYVPIMKAVLEIQDVVFDLGDELGLGDEVRTLVYGIRAFEYASVLAPSGALAAAGAVSVGAVSGFAALGAVGVVALVVFSLFGGDCEEEERKRAKRAQARLVQMVRRLDLAGLAAEQEARASGEQLFADHFAVLGDPAPHARAADQARRLARLYRAADKRLTARQRALFESISNLGRWRASLAAQMSLSKTKRDALSNLLDTRGDSIEWRLTKKIRAEEALLAKLGRRTPRIELRLPGTGRPGGHASWLVETALEAAVGALVVYAGARAWKGR